MFLPILSGVKLLNPNFSCFSENHDKSILYMNCFIPSIQNPIECLVWIMNSNYDILIKGNWILCYSGQTWEPAGWGGGIEGSKGWADHKKRSKHLTISYLNLKIELHLTCLKWIDDSNNVITSPNGLRLNFKLIWKSLADIVLKRNHHLAVIFFFEWNF